MGTERTQQPSATTVLDFTLLQPLLRGAGRDRVMERLTLSERNLLANVRSFERYRRSFYLNVTTGRNIESTVRRSGGVFGVGLGGFTGLGGGFAGLGGGGARELAAEAVTLRKQADSWDCYKINCKSETCKRTLQD